MKETFVTAINCIDRRVQKSEIDLAVESFRADYVDMVTELDPDKILSENRAFDADVYGVWVDSKWEAVLI